MKHALVTGGCGFLGSSIVRELLDAGVKVRVLALPSEPTTNVDGLDVEIVRGNVLSIADAKAAVFGVDTVFHAAAVYKAYMVDPTPMYDVNLRGTFNVLEAARRAEVERVVYTASIVSLGRSGAGAIGDESTPFDAWDVDFAYSRSKYHSRILAEDFAAWGLDVRIVCPAVVLGPRDIAPTPSGQLIINTMKSRSGAYTGGGISYVDVRDAARVHTLVAERGAPGERYIATAHNLSNKDFLIAVAKAGGFSPRLVKLPGPLVSRLIRAVEWQARRRGVEPPIASAMFEYAESPAYFSNEKVKNSFGVQFRPLSETLNDAIEYFRGRGAISG